MIKRVTRAEPQTEEVEGGETGYIVLRKQLSEWYVTESPFKEVQVSVSLEEALKMAQSGEYIIPITLPKVAE